MSYVCDKCGGTRSCWSPSVYAPLPISADDAEITRLRTELAEAQAQLSANEDGYVAHLKAELAEARKDAGRLRAELLDRAIYASMVDDPNQRVIGCDLCGAVACATSGYAVPHNNGCLAIDTAMANGAQEGTKG